MVREMLVGLALFTIGFIGAFVSGLLGIGGALVLIPLLLYGPPVVGITALTVQEVTGISVAQVFLAGLLGAISHGRHGNVNRRLVIGLGIPMAVGAGVGGALAAYTSGRLLLLVFAIMATLALVLILMPSAAEEAAADSIGTPVGAGIGGGVGLVAGLIGAGGAFLLQPILIQGFRLNPRTVVGSSLGITLLGTTMAVAGKAATGQIPFPLVLWALAGSVPGTLIGAWVSQKLSVSRLRAILAAIIAVVCVRAWLSVFVV